MATRPANGGPAYHTRQQCRLRDRDNRMADAGWLSPPIFTGTEDPSLWLSNFTNYAAVKGLNAAQQLATIPLLFRSTPANWFATLPAEAKDTVEHFRTTFQATFVNDPAMLWAKERDLYSQKQLPGQSALDFITAVQMKARTLNLQEAQQMRIILGGLLPSIRSFVIQRAPATMAALTTAAKLAEQTISGQQDQGINSVLLAELHSIKEKMEKMELKQVPQVHPAQPVSPPQYMSSYQRPIRYIRGSNRGSRSYQPRTPSAPHQQPRDPPPSQNRTSGQPTCHRCGEYHTHSSSQCRAQNLQCFHCHKMGHVIKACRMARRQAQVHK